MFNQTIFTFRNRLINILLGIAYAVFYHFIYVNFVFHYFEYLGAEYNSLSFLEYILYTLFASIPLFFYIGLTTIASSISIFTYIFVYVPMLLSIYVTKCMHSNDGSLLIVFLFVFQCVLFITDNNYLLKSFFTSKSQKLISFSVIELIAIISLLVLLISFGSNLKFVNILTESDAMYELRMSYGDTRSAWQRYLLSWAINGFLPLLLLVYLKQKNKRKICFVLIAFVLTFMMDMKKITLIMPFAIIGMYYIINKGRDIGKYFHYYFIGLFIIVPSILYLTITNSISFGIASILIMRTQCVCGWLSSIYFNFFTAPGHPFTNFTHINIINFLTGNSYPYREELGRVVCDGVMNANANFVLTDGYAAIGIWGIPFITIVIVIIKSTLNSIGIKYNAQLVIVAFLSAISAMMNASAFTAILTCGLFILYLCFAKCDLTELCNQEFAKRQIE